MVLIHQGSFPHQTDDTSLSFWSILASTFRLLVLIKQNLKEGKKRKNVA